MRRRDLIIPMTILLGCLFGWYGAVRISISPTLRLTGDTAIIVALITLIGTFITAIGGKLLDRIWPEKKKEDR